MSEKEQQLREALKRSSQALNDWLNVYASLFCDEKRVNEARKRIRDSGGTVAYIADVVGRNEQVLKD